jgi:hypothetical protein
VLILYYVNVREIYILNGADWQPVHTISIIISSLLITMKNRYNIFLRTNLMANLYTISYKRSYLRTRRP